MADSERPVESVTVRLEEGSRCVCEGFYGTVRYVGEVPPSKGEQSTLATVGAWDKTLQSAIIWWAANGYIGHSTYLLHLLPFIFIPLLHCFLIGL